MGTAPASASEAMEMVHAGLGWLAAADATQLGAETQARCLRMLEQADAMGTAARASVLAAFTSGQGYSADADYSPRAWLMHKTGVTRGAAAGHTAWARRAAAHPHVAAALAAKEMSESWTAARPWSKSGSPRCGPHGRRSARPRPRAAGTSGRSLDGDAARAVACDAAIAPVVTGEVNPAALDDMVRLCVQLDKLRHGASDGDGGTGAEGQVPADTTRAWEAIEQAIVGKAIDLLSGPGGLASFLRRRQLGVRLGGPSLPLDIGYAETIPAGIRDAVILRDKRCRWAGGCNQPAAACEVHHVKHKANGGKTSTKGCVLLCFYHHQVMIHRQGWTLVLNPDGSTTAWNKDRTKVLHSHGPPARSG